MNETNSAHWSQLSALSLKISALSITLSVTPGVKIALNQAGGGKWNIPLSFLFSSTLPSLPLLPLSSISPTEIFRCDRLQATLRVRWHWVRSIIGRNNGNRETAQPHQSTLWVSALSCWKLRKADGTQEKASRAKPCQRPYWATDTVESEVQFQCQAAATSYKPLPTKWREDHFKTCS